MNTEHAPRAKKSLGQNFLQDANIARKIVAALDLCEDDSVLEIGPGPGALTRFVAESPKKRFLIAEKDTYWAEHHASAFAGCSPATSFQGALAMADTAGAGVFLGDAMALPWADFESGRWKIVGNLPYNVASPLMWDIFSEASVRRAVFMVQKEVGLRLAAKPGTKAYGALSVWIQSFVTPVVSFIVPPQVFRPQPKVHSAVVTFTPVPPDQYLFDKAGLAWILKKTFQQRRKQLGTIFRDSGEARNIFESLNIDHSIRPEMLTPQDFHALSKYSFLQTGIDNNTERVLSTN